MINNNIKAGMLIAFSGILYGFLGYFGTRVLQQNISINAMLFWRFTVAGIWMLLFVVKNQVMKQTIGHVNKRAFFYLFFVGALCYSGSSALYFMASYYTGTGLAMVIFFSNPIIVALLSWVLYRQSLKIGVILSLVVMVGGLFLLRDTSTEHVFSLWGIFLGIASAVCYAFYMVFTKRFSSARMDSTILTTIICFGCALVCLIATLATQSFSLPDSWASWIYLLALGVIATALPIQLMLEGLKHLSSMRASIISVLEPIVTVVAGVFLLGEFMTAIQMLGAFIILGSALLVQFQRGL